MPVSETIESKKSGTTIRVYDKTKEMADKGKYTSKDHPLPNTLRFEISLKKQPDVNSFLNETKWSNLSQAHLEQTFIKKMFVEYVDYIEKKWLTGSQKEIEKIFKEAKAKYKRNWYDNAIEQLLNNNNKNKDSYSVSQICDVYFQMKKKEREKQKKKVKDGQRIPNNTSRDIGKIKEKIYKVDNCVLNESTVLEFVNLIKKVIVKYTLH